MFTRHTRTRLDARDLLLERAPHVDSRTISDIAGTPVDDNERHRQSVTWEYDGRR